MGIEVAETSHRGWSGFHDRVRVAHWARLSILAALISFFPSLPVIAGQTQSQAQYLDRFVKACSSKRWAECNLARYDLPKAGFRIEVSETGDPYLKPPSKRAAKLYYETLEHLTGESADMADQESLYGLVHSHPDATGYTQTVAMFWDVRDSGMRWAGLDVIKLNFERLGIQYDVTAEEEDPRFEFMRQLALAYTVRGEVVEAMWALQAMQQAALNKGMRQSAKATQGACEKYMQLRHGPRKQSPATLPAT